MRSPSTLAATSLLLALSSVVSAADLWIQPDPIQPQRGAAVAVGLYEGRPFEGSEHPYREDEVGLFQRLWKQGRAELRAAEGSVPAASFAAERAGVQLLAFESSGGDRFCKSIVVVGDPPEGDPLRWSELGQTLEIVPQSDPVTLIRRGGVLEVQVLFEREPLADASVSFVPQSQPAAAVSLRTDEIGVARLRLDRSGLWLVRTAHASLVATLTFAAGERRAGVGS